MSERITVTKIEVREGKKGPYPALHIAGEKFPKFVFGAVNQAETSNGEGVYEVEWEYRDNPKSEEFPYKNIKALKFVGTAEGPTQEAAQVPAKAQSQDFQRELSPASQKRVARNAAFHVAGAIVAQAIGSKQIAHGDAVANVAALTNKLVGVLEES